MMASRISLSIRLEIDLEAQIKFLLLMLTAMVTLTYSLLHLFPTTLPGGRTMVCRTLIGM